MISQKFSIIPEDKITSFMSESENQKEEALIDSIESISDLWILAKIKESYNEENYIHNSHIDNVPDMLSSI